MVFRDKTTSLNGTHGEHHQREGIRTKQVGMMNREVSRDNQKKKELRLQRRVKNLLTLSENKFCLDCSKPRPRWATLVVISPPLKGLLSIKADILTEGGNRNVNSKSPRQTNIAMGSFCCLECSGSHRKLGTHITFVRSVDLDTFQEHEVQALESAGNKVVNSIFEARLYSDHAVQCDRDLDTFNTIKPNTNSNQESRELFIKKKYNDKCYINKDLLREYYCNQAGIPYVMEHTSESGSSFDDIDTDFHSVQCKTHDPTKHLNNSLTPQAFTTSPRTISPKTVDVKLEKKKKVSKLCKMLSRVHTRADDYEQHSVSDENEDITGSESLRNKPEHFQEIVMQNTHSISDPNALEVKPQHYSSREFNAQQRMLKRLAVYSSSYDCDNDSDTTDPKTKWICWPTSSKHNKKENKRNELEREERNVIFDFQSSSEDMDFDNSPLLVYAKSTLNDEKREKKDIKTFEQ